jgi:hypothetical protein
MIFILLAATSALNVDSIIATATCMHFIVWSKQLWMFTITTFLLLAKWIPDNATFSTVIITTGPSNATFIGVNTTIFSSSAIFYIIVTSTIPSNASFIDVVTTTGSSNASFLNFIAITLASNATFSDVITTIGIICECLIYIENDQSLQYHVNPCF